jgi:hypothetical protein
MDVEEKAGCVWKYLGGEFKKSGLNNVWGGMGWLISVAFERFVKVFGVGGGECKDVFIGTGLEEGGYGCFGNVINETITIREGGKERVE